MERMWVQCILCCLVEFCVVFSWLPEADVERFSSLLPLVLLVDILDVELYERLDLIVRQLGVSGAETQQEEHSLKLEKSEGEVAIHAHSGWWLSERIQARNVRNPPDS